MPCPVDMTPKEIFEGRIATRLNQNPAIATNINASFQFDLTGDNGGTWSIDLTKPSDFVSSGAHANPKVTITMSSKDFVDLVEGRLNGMMAFTAGKLKLKGDVSLAMKLQQILG